MRLTRQDWVRLLLLWLGGIDLRLTLLAVPPLIPQIHHELHLDEKGVGALVSLPVLLLATAAVPGSLLIAGSVFAGRSRPGSDWSPSSVRCADWGQARRCCSPPPF